jgi:hypothetical protein
VRWRERERERKRGGGQRGEEDIKQIIKYQERGKSKGEYRLQVNCIKNVGVCELRIKKRTKEQNQNE